MIGAAQAGAMTMRDDARQTQSREALSLQRAAHLLDVHEDTIRRWWKAGRIDLVRVGKKLLRVPISEIRRLRVEGEEIDRGPSPAMPRGSVYLVESLGMVKIGVTCYLDERIKILQQQSAAPIRLRGALAFTSYAEAQRVELALHQRFRAKRRHGEWFALAEADIVSILTTEHGSPPS